MHLIYFASPGLPDKGTIAKYEHALEPLGAFELKWIAIPGFSQVFVQEAMRLRKGGRVIPGLLDAYQPRRPHSTLSLIGFSAGCWFARECFRDDRDREAIDAFVALDGVHDSAQTSSVPNDPELGPYYHYAKRAAASQNLFWLGHTDVPVATYASTTVAAKRLTDAVPPAGDWYVRPYDLFPAAQAKAEHGAALTTWGPSFVAEALVSYLGRASITPPPAWRDPVLSLGERAVEFSLAEISRGNLETQGVNAGPRIAEYFKPAIRTVNGVERPLGIRSGNWCAVGACFAESQALFAGEEPSHPYRASGVELQNDSLRSGRWRPVELVKAGKWSPHRGDLVILKRGTGWERHVCRFETTIDGYGAYRTVDANHGNSWALVDRPLHAPELLGFVDCSTPMRASTEVLAVLAALQKAAGVFVEGLRGLVGGTG